MSAVWTPTKVMFSPSIHARPVAEHPRIASRDDHSETSPLPRLKRRLFGSSPSVCFGWKADIRGEVRPRSCDRGREGAGRRLGAARPRPRDYFGIEQGF